jgi:hypothetical protein
MDNFVMITAGEAIDQTFGVAFGISTMAAAGFGQCVSDVAGVTSGGLVDSAVSKLRLPEHGLTQQQLGLTVSRKWSTLGACCGVLSGCLIGMSILLFIDTDRADRAKRAKELNSIFETVMEEGHKLVHAERATLFMLDEDKKELWSRVGTGIKGIIKVGADEGLVGSSVSTDQVVNVADAYKDPRFNKDVDKETGFLTKSVLVVPVLSREAGKEVIGAIQLINKKDSDGKTVQFTQTDEDIVKVLANHVACFIKIVESSN